MLTPGMTLYTAVIRTVRRFMEAHPPVQGGGGLGHVVFCCEGRQDMEVYRRLMPLYFPRGLSDVELQRANLPEDIGNERGEPVVEDRQVPSHKP